MEWNLTAVWNWIKDKGIWMWQNWYILLAVIVGILIIIWFIKRLIVGIKSDN